MPEETRYFTISGDVPNGGVPPGRMFASVGGLPYPGNYPFNPAPLSGGHGPPPPYHAPQHDGNGGGHQPYYPTLHPGPPPPAPPAPQAAAPSPPAPVTQYEPPGQYMDGHMMHGDGWSYITPSEHTTIHFVGDGTRPCDAPNGYHPHRFAFTKHKVPTTMTVKDLIKRLGAPAGDQNGITEMEELGNNRFTAGITITQGSEDAKKTLAETGWTQRRSEAAPIWFVVKR